MSVIELVGVTKGYPGQQRQAIDAVSLCIEKGEILALLGPSGSGKTTLLRLIAGFEAPDQGSILLRGEKVSRPGYTLMPEKRGIGMVFQDYALFPHLTVEENVAFGLHRMKESYRRKKVKEVVELVGLSSLAGRYPHELSGGEQQRVALGRALAPDPIIIMLDEPFSHLDREMREEMRHEVSRILRRTGSTAILVTHDHEEAFAMADRIAVLNEGRLEQMDVPDMIYHLPTTPFVANFVGQADFLPGIFSRGTVVTEIGPFSSHQDYPEGTAVVVMIRPDDIDLRASPDGTIRVISRQFKGEENLYTIRLPSGQRLHSSQHSLTVYPEGSGVALTLKVTHTVIYQAEAFGKGLTGNGTRSYISNEFDNHYQIKGPGG